MAPTFVVAGLFSFKAIYLVFYDQKCLELKLTWTCSWKPFTFDAQYLIHIFELLKFVSRFHYVQTFSSIHDWLSYLKLLPKLHNLSANHKQQSAPHSTVKTWSFQICKMTFLLNFHQFHSAKKHPKGSVHLGEESCSVKVSGTNPKEKPFGFK